MAHQGKAGHIGHAVDTVFLCDLTGVFIEGCHLLYGALVQLRRGQLGAVGGGGDANAQGFGEDEHIPFQWGAIHADLIGTGKAGHGKAVFRLLVIDGMAAGDDDAGLIGFLVAAAQHLVDHLLGHLRGHGHDIECDLWGGAHGVNIADGVCCGDLPEHVGIIHNGREEIQRLHNGQIIAYLINGGVVAGIVAHQQVFILYRGDALQDLAQHSRAYLGAAAPAGGKFAHFNITLHFIFPPVIWYSTIHPPECRPRWRWPYRRG